ncbi:esterase-like activity of phytase family protein [Phenylobacterium sp. VNQ135]|uniref:esterase-like activity of phytase family protein n=1 Tax=Phenylobacterium sp. VNQ135 TaxID=3400922 RepID=UPI003C006C8C
MRRLAGLAAALLLASCVDGPPARLPPAPVAYGTAIVVDGQPVPLDPTDPARTRIGNFTYAGGLALTSQQTSRLGGLSDLKVTPDGRLTALGDQSDLLEAQIVLDGQGRLSGLSQARITALKEVTGADLYAGGQEEYDSEGVVRLADGTLIATFEQHDRVLAFPADGGLPRAAPAPQTAYKHNKGMEAAMAAPEAGPDAYRVGLENTGQLFLCRLSTRCVPDGQVDLEGSELVGMDALPGGGRAYLFRSYSPLIGNVIRLRLTDRGGRTIDVLEIRRPLTVDNIEGVAAVAQAAGRVRFYLVSDDNFGSFEGHKTDQRTLLLAFDWTRK